MCGHRNLLEGIVDVEAKVANMADGQLILGQGYRWD